MPASYEFESARSVAEHVSRSGIAGRVSSARAGPWVPNGIGEQHLRGKAPQAVGTVSGPAQRAHDREREHQRQVNRERERERQTEGRLQTRLDSMEQAVGRLESCLAQTTQEFDEFIRVSSAQQVAIARLLAVEQ